MTPARQHRRGRRPATKLQRELARGGEPSRPTALDAFRLARRKFLAAERVDMSALADELGVNRATLYRWVGTLDQLLVEIIWSLGERTLENIDDVGTTGAERIVQIITRFL